VSSVARLKDTTAAAASAAECPSFCLQSQPCGTMVRRVSYPINTALSCLLFYSRSVPSLRCSWIVSPTIVRVTRKPSFEVAPTALVQWTRQSTNDTAGYCLFTMWHVSSRSGVATLRTAIHLLLTYLLTVFRLTRVCFLATVVSSRLQNSVYDFFKWADFDGVILKKDFKSGSFETECSYTSVFVFLVFKWPL